MAPTFGKDVAMRRTLDFLALNLGGVRYPWFSSPVLALVGCALVLGGGFVVRQLTTQEPLIPLAILADRTARLAMLAHSFGWGSILALNIFLPMYLQSVLGWSATSSGLSLIVLMVTLNASAGLIYPTALRANGVGYALGIGRVGSVSGPLIGSLLTRLEMPAHTFFYITAIGPLLCAGATVLLLNRLRNTQRGSVDAAAPASAAST